MTPPAATAAGRALPRTAVPRAPRRVSGPARPAARRTRTTAAPSTVDGSFAVRALHRGRLLADSRLLDRLVRGQLWIPVVAVALMGIVFMQVTMLKLNAEIGRGVQTAATLERQNANLRSDVSRMESGERIDTVAHGLGMVVPADGGEHYVRAGGADTAARAAQKMTAPDPEALARAQAATAAAAPPVTAAVSAPATSAVTTPAAVASAPAPTATPVATQPAATPTSQQAPVAQPTPTPTPTPATQQAQAPAPSPAVPSATTAAATAGGAIAPAGN